MAYRKVTPLIIVLILAIWVSVPRASAAGQVIRVGVEENLPMQAIIAHGVPEGLVLDVLGYIAVVEGWELEYVPCEWVDCLAMLENGEIDLLGGIAYSEERSSRIDFSSQALITNWGVVCVRPESNIDSLLELEGRTVAALNNDIHTQGFLELVDGFDITVELLEAPDYATALQMVADQVADAGVVSRLYAAHHAADYGLLQTSILFNPIEIRFAATKGAHQDLLTAIDLHLSQLRDDPLSVYYSSLDNWLSTKPVSRAPSWLGWLISFSGWVIVVALVSIFYLRRTIASRTAELAENNEKLAQEVIERRKAEDALRQLNEELEQRVRERTALLEAANRELESFAYSISHDLRAPLRAIEAFSEILLTEYSGQMDAEGRFYQQRVRSNAMLMNDLIQALLNFSRLSRQPMMRELVVPTELVKEVIADLEPVYNDRRMDFKVMEMTPCYADYTLIRQVFANLINNAVKFTSNRAQAEITIGSLTQDEEVVYYVQDNGIGFDMSDAEKIFEVFYRLHGVDQYEGSGVGLAMVQRIVQRHGGRIWTHSEKDKGATFFFTVGTTDED